MNCKKYLITLILLIFSSRSLAVLGDKPYQDTWGKNFSIDVANDFKNYIKPDRLIWFGNMFLVSAVLANTGFDRAFGAHWQNDIRSRSTDSIFSVPKSIGGLSYYYAPIFLTAMGVGHYRQDTLLGNVFYHWGYRSIRTFILGGLQQVTLTHLLGSGRPSRNEDSKWQPFYYQTGVSGHAFYGAIPFLTAAMMTDPPLIKYSLYFLSTLPALSRINSNAHYLSQIIMGWGIAFLSAKSIYDTDLEREPKFHAVIHPRADGMMLSVGLPL